MPKLHQFINLASSHQWIITDQSRFCLSYRKYLRRLFTNRYTNFWKQTISFHRTNLDFDDHIQNSTQLPIFQTVRKHMYNGEYTGAVFVDLKKAFDTVDHRCLLSKLPSYGIKGRELNWFESYLFDRKQFVSLENSSSERESVLCSVLQGSVLGPLLFALLINDINLQLKHCSILLYAEYTVIFTVDKNCKVIEERLNTDLNKITNWFSDNNLIMNLMKNRVCPLWDRTKTSRIIEISHRSS